MKLLSSTASPRTCIAQMGPDAPYVDGFGFVGVKLSKGQRGGLGSVIGDMSEERLVVGVGPGQQCWSENLPAKFETGR
jgi:hypothetical protein